ncbi:MAG TPA: ATP-binding protein [Terriglobales bacterium]|nr:ATP-binding protein [Terriglobales bacterium]
MGRALKTLWRPPDMPRHAALHVLAIVGMTLVISAMHYYTPDELVERHYLIQRLFYIPVAYAGLYFGWRGGLAAGLLAGIAYGQQIISIWKVVGKTTIVNQYTEVVLFCIVGTVTGLLADRERKQKKALQETAAQLAQVYGELQQNFEKMKRAERLYALGQLSAGLAHEIRNPLASIEGATSILLREPPSEERRVEFLEIIQKECRRLNRLLTQFLNFAKPAPPEYKTIPLDQLFDSVIGLAEHTVRRDQITLCKEIPEGMQALECDPEQLTQVLLNLTINAIQAMPNGGAIVLGARRHGDDILMYVRDEGSGISERDMERIFDPFFTTKESGTGLGLPVAHQIVSRQGGVLSATRNADKGMTFTIELPTHRKRTE